MLRPGAALCSPRLPQNLRRRVERYAPEKTLSRKFTVQFGHFLETLSARPLSTRSPSAGIMLSASTVVRAARIGGDRRRAGGDRGPDGACGVRGGARGAGGPRRSRGVRAL